jgi:GntR family transcriptional regulator
MTAHPDVFGEGSASLRAGPVTLHHQIYRHLREAIDDGRLKPGDRLPGERELCEVYGCSLITIRRALEELTRERRLVRMRGRGTFVTEPPLERNLQMLGSFSEEMRERGLEPGTRMLGARQAPAPAAVATALDLEAGARCLVLDRLRLADGQPVMLEEVHLPAARFPDLLSADLEHDSLYELMANRYGTRMEYAQETVEAVSLDARSAQLLEQRRGRPALLLVIVGYDQDRVPVEHCRSIIPGDRARYHVDARGARAGELRVISQ